MIVTVPAMTIMMIILRIIVAVIAMSVTVTTIPDTA
jgi:hypothetical protein